MVDDAPVGRVVLARILATVHDVVEADNGASALALAQGTRFDVVLTDVNMPVMDGFELARMLRGMPSYAHTPIFATTTEARRAEIARGNAVGITAWIVKPVDGRVLLRAISEVLGRAGASTSRDRDPVV